MDDHDEENTFLINFYKKHFSGTNIPIYSKEVLYKLIEEIHKVEGEKCH